MSDAPTLPPDEERLRTISDAVARVEQAELELQEAVDTAREAGDPEDAIRVVLTARDSAMRVVVRHLVDRLGPTYVAALAGAASKQHATGWAEPDGPVPGPEAARRLRLAHKVLTLVAGDQGDDAARAWMVRAAPDLGGDTPLAAIKKDRVREVTSAVESLIDGRPDR